MNRLRVRELTKLPAHREFYYKEGTIREVYVIESHTDGYYFVKVNYCIYYKGKLQDAYLDDVDKCYNIIDDLEAMEDAN